MKDVILSEVRRGARSQRTCFSQRPTRAVSTLR